MVREFKDSSNNNYTYLENWLGSSTYSTSTFYGDYRTFTSRKAVYKATTQTSDLGPLIPIPYNWNSNYTILEVDVSSVSGEYIIGYCGGNRDNTYGKIYEIYLE